MTTLDLFAPRAELGLDRAFTTAKRAPLDQASWVELVPEWLRGGDELLQVLVEAVPWKHHHRKLFDQIFLEPRMTAQYKSLRDLPHRALRDAASALSDHYGVVYDNLWSISIVTAATAPAGIATDSRAVDPSASCRC